MKIRILLLSLICAVTAAPVMQAADKDETVLGGHMDKMGGAFRKLKRQAPDATKNADSLTLVATIKTSAESALAFKPEITAEKPAADQAKFVEGYKTEMKKMLELVGKLEAALKAGKNDEAVKLITSLEEQRNSSHKEYKKQKPKA